MGIHKNSQLIAIVEDTNSICPAKSIKIGNYTMTDMCTSKIYFKDHTKNEKLLLKFTILDESNLSTISVTYNHVMLKVDQKVINSYNELVSVDSTTTTSEIPQILKCDEVLASDMKVGDLIPRWAGSFGIIIKIEHEMAKTVQLMTVNGLLMIDKNIITCYVKPHNMIKRLSTPLLWMSNINKYLVAKPFYFIPKKIYNVYIHYND